MSSKNSIAIALAKAQTEFTKAFKDAKNPHFRSTYATLQSVMAAVMPALNANGIALIQTEGRGDHGPFVDTILLHGESGEDLTTRSPIIQGKVDSQGYLAGLTYARRGGVMTLCGIAPADDDDGETGRKSPPVEKPATLTADQQAELLRLASLADILPSAVAEKGLAPSIPQIHQSRFHGLEKGLQGAVDRKHDEAVKQLDGDAIPEFENEKVSE